MATWQTHINRLRGPGERRRKAGKTSSSFDAVAKLLHPGAVVVDAGCGESGDRFLARRCGFESVGIDLLPVKNRKGFVQADCSMAIPLTSQSVDAVLCHAMITLLPPATRWRFYDEVARVLKPGGYFSMTVYPLSGGFAFQQVVEQGRLDAAGFHRLRAGVFQRCQANPCRNRPTLETFEDITRIVTEIDEAPLFVKTGSIFLALLMKGTGKALVEFTGYGADDIGNVIDGLINADIMFGEDGEFLDLPWMTDYNEGNVSQGNVTFAIDMMAVGGQLKRWRTDDGPRYCANSVSV
jgi:SAM-dependent methyltransferase